MTNIENELSLYNLLERLVKLWPHEWITRPSFLFKKHLDEITDIERHRQSLSKSEIEIIDQIIEIVGLDEYLSSIENLIMSTRHQVYLEYAQIQLVEQELRIAETLNRENEALKKILEIEKEKYDERFAAQNAMKERIAKIKLREEEIRKAAAEQRRLEEEQRERLKQEIQAQLIRARNQMVLEDLVKTWSLYWNPESELVKEKFKRDPHIKAILEFLAPDIRASVRDHMYPDEILECLNGKCANEYHSSNEKICPSCGSPLDAYHTLTLDCWRD